MRPSLLIIWFLFPCLGNTTTPLSTNIGANAPTVFHSALETRPAETGFLKKIAGKILQKQVLKNNGIPGQRYSENGPWLAIIGLACGVLSIACVVIPLLMASWAGIWAFLAVLLCMGGFIISLIALKRSATWSRRQRVIRAIALAGLILNSIPLSFVLTLFLLALVYQPKSNSSIDFSSFNSFFFGR